MSEPNTADVLEQDGPTTQIDAEELTDANPEGGEVDPQATPKHTDDEIRPGKRPGGWQRKIQKQQEQIETLLELVRKGGGDAKPAPVDAKPTEDKPPAKPVRPKVSDFQTWEEYEAAQDKYETARDDYHEKNLAYHLKKADAEKQQKSQQQTIADGWATQVVKAREEFADFEDVAFSEDTPMTQAMMDAIVTSEHGAKIAYELGKNPDEAERIAKLNPVAAIREIGKIESRIAGTKPAAEKEDDKEADEPPAASTRAPKPPSPVRRTTSVNQDPDDKDDYKTWLRKREAQLARK